MNILYITEKIPYPVYLDGSTLINHHLLLELNQHYNVDLISFGQEGVPKGYVYNLCQKYYGVKKQKRRSILSYVRGTLALLPPVYYDKSDEFTELLNNVLAKKKYDLIFVDSISMDVYTYDIQHIYKVISLHDSIGLLYKTYKRNSKYIFTKLYYSFCEYIYKKRERKIINEYSKCIFVSDKDKKFLMGNNKRNDSKIVVIPNGVNQCLLDKGDKFITDVNTIVFSGIMDYKPNIDAVVYFVNCVLPLILEANKNIIFYIVGKNPTAEVTQLKSDNVIVTGWVDDISEYVCKGSVYVSPLITGAGLKNKILEAMALKRPIVASSISVDGLNIKDGYHLYVADSREVFADKVLNLLNSSDKRDFLVKNAYELVGEEYTWDVVLNRYRRYIFDIKAES